MCRKDKTKKGGILKAGTLYLKFKRKNKEACLLEHQIPTTDPGYPVSGGGRNSRTRGGDSGGSLLRWAGRFALTAVILFLVSFFTPGFSITGMWSFFLAAIVISLLDYFAERLMGVDVRPFGRGLKGFALSAIILYLAQFLVPNMNVTVLGAVLGAVAIGILDAVFPTQVM